MIKWEQRRNFPTKSLQTHTKPEVVIIRLEHIKNFPFNMLSHNSPILREQTVNTKMMMIVKEWHTNTLTLKSEIETKSGCEQINLVTFFIFIFITFIMRFFRWHYNDYVIYHDMALNKAEWKRCWRRQRKIEILSLSRESWILLHIWRNSQKTKHTDLSTHGAASY